MSGVENLMDSRFPVTEDSFAEVVIWKLEAPLAGCAHSLKYSMVLVVKGKCVLRYDNEAGKGDHRHHRGKEATYAFISLDKLTTDFWNDVNDEVGE